LLQKEQVLCNITKVCINDTIFVFNALISSERSEHLLRRLSVTACKQVLFTDEKMFYINPPVRTQNDTVWSAGRKCDVSPSRLLIERAKFAPRVMVSAGVCLQGKGRLHFVQEKSKTNADYYVNLRVATEISG